jgi:type IV pilus assembly protein PilB
MKIGEIFVKEGILSSDQLRIVLEEQKKTHDRLGDIVLKMGFVPPQKMAPILAKYFDIPFVKLSENYKNIKSEIIDLVPSELARRFSIIPVDAKDNTMTVAMYDPLDLVAIDTLRLKTGYRIKCVLALEKEIIDAIDYCYQDLPRLQKHIDQFIDLEMEEVKGEKKEVEAQSFQADDQPVVQYAKSLIIQALNSQASDIHLEPKEEEVKLRFRIDGVLYDMKPPPKAMLAAIISRVKILSGLDIAEKRLPQDGRLRVKMAKGEIDLRISCFPTIYGESVVMRLLETSAPRASLEDLGLTGSDLEHLRYLIGQSYGLILVTGPTGSGKTTTLYSALNEIRSTEKKMITLEDPVEYRLPFIQQTQVNPLIGLDFARGLRSIVRQDPDVIMVGEIRDRESAEIAINAALTGHLVFSTLHANDSAGATARLIKMGVEPFLIASSLLCVVAQRLVRTICPECRERKEVSPEVLQRLSKEQGIKDFFKGRGCIKCFYSGYKGRRGLFEILLMNEDIRRLILEKRSSDEIRSLAQSKGMKTLRQAGTEVLRAGLTTPEELLRVTQDTDEINL